MNVWKPNFFLQTGLPDSLPKPPERDHAADEKFAAEHLVPQTPDDAPEDEAEVAEDPAESPAQYPAESPAQYPAESPAQYPAQYPAQKRPRGRPRVQLRDQLRDQARDRARDRAERLAKDGPASKKRRGERGRDKIKRQKRHTKIRYYVDPAEKDQAEKDLAEKNRAEKDPAEKDSDEDPDENCPWDCASEQWRAGERGTLVPSGQRTLGENRDKRTERPQLLFNFYEAMRSSELREEDADDSIAARKTHVEYNSFSTNERAFWEYMHALYKVFEKTQLAADAMYSLSAANRKRALCLKFYRLKKPDQEQLVRDYIADRWESENYNYVRQTIYQNNLRDLVGIRKDLKALLEKVEMALIGPNVGPTQQAKKTGSSAQAAQKQYEPPQAWAQAR